MNYIQQQIDSSSDLSAYQAKVNHLLKQMTIWELYHELLIRQNLKDYHEDGCNVHSSHQRHTSEKITVPLKTFIALACDKLASMSDRQSMMVHLSRQEFDMLSTDHYNELAQKLIMIIHASYPHESQDSIKSEINSRIQRKKQEINQELQYLDKEDLLKASDNHIESCHGLPFVSADMIVKANKKSIQKQNKQPTIEQ